MDIVALDIETVPNVNIPKECIPQFDPDSVKMGNIKDVEKAEAKIRLEEKIFDEGLIKKMSLDFDLCQVVCFVLHDSSLNHLVVRYDENESWNVSEAWEFIKSAYFAHHPLVTYNGIHFDLPILWHAAIRHNIPVNREMYLDLTKRYNNMWHYDLMQILADWDRQKWKPFDFYLNLYGLGNKSGKGSDVYGWWQKKKYEKIRKYCEHDVDMLVKLWERLEPYLTLEI